MSRIYPSAEFFPRASAGEDLKLSNKPIVSENWMKNNEV